VLRIQGAPTVRILQSSPYRVRPHEKVRLECEATGDPKANLIWRRVSQQPYSSVPSLIGSTGTEGKAIIEISNVTAADAGVYVVCIEFTITNWLQNSIEYTFISAPVLQLLGPVRNAFI